MEFPGSSSAGWEERGQGTFLQSGALERHLPRPRFHADKSHASTPAQGGDRLGREWGGAAGLQTPAWAGSLTGIHGARLQASETPPVPRLLLAGQGLSEAGAPGAERRPDGNA